MGQFRRGDAGHHGRVFANEISHVSHITALLQQVIAALQVCGEEVEMAVPRVLSVEFLSPRAVQARQFLLFGLRNDDVQQRVVNAFGEEFIAPLLHVSGASREFRRAAGERFSRYFRLAVDVGGRRCRAVFDVSQRAFAPEFACNLVRLSAILQEFARESPVAVALKPER